MYGAGEGGVEVGPDREAGRAKEVSYLRVGGSLPTSGVLSVSALIGSYAFVICHLLPISFCTSHYTDSLHTVLCGQRTLFMEMCAVPLGDL